VTERLLPPTQQQIGEFWEWCGLGCVHTWEFLAKTPLYGVDCTKCGKEFRKSQWSNARAPKIGDFDEFPPIDANCLLKYAIPRLVKVKVVDSDGLYFTLQLVSGACEYDVEIRTWNGRLVYDTPHEDIGQDPALALFWALWQAKEEGLD